MRGVVRANCRTLCGRWRDRVFQAGQANRRVRLDPTAGLDRLLASPAVRRCARSDCRRPACGSRSCRRVRPRPWKSQRTYTSPRERSSPPRPRR
jgi:hypothetical protein